MIDYKNTNSEIEISPSDISNKASNINQLIDILGVDVASINSSSVNQNTRKKYEVFVSGTSDSSTGTSEITSSIYQTVHDQDITYQTSNELFDITVGLYEGSTEVSDTNPTTDSSGKKIFSDTVLMMREKINIYRQYAQYLLGDADGYFTAPYDVKTLDSTSSQRIDSAIFLNFKRLFTRDSIAKDSFAIKINKKRSDNHTDSLTGSGTDPTIYSDSGAKTNHRITGIGGTVASLIDNSSNEIGLVFYERGIVVLDAKKVFDYETFDTDTAIVETGIAVNDICKIVSLGNTNQAGWEAMGLPAGVEAVVGVVFKAAATGTGTGTVYKGTEILDGDIQAVTTNSANTGKVAFTHNMKNLFVSSSIDDVIDHVCSTRFDRETKSSIAFQNKTIINSSLIFCRAAPSECNYSSNPTYIKPDGAIRVVDDENDDPFAYVTTIGLYSAKGDLVAVAKTSRPIEKNPETDLSIRIRLDY